MKDRETKLMKLLSAIMEKGIDIEQIYIQEVMTKKKDDKKYIGLSILGTSSMKLKIFLKWMKKWNWVVQSIKVLMMIPKLTINPPKRKSKH